MKGRMLLGCLAIISLLVAVPATRATTVLDLQIEDLVAIAPVVVVGEVNQVAAEWNAGHTTIYTKVAVTTAEVLKGPKALASVTVKTIGGTVGKTVAEMPGAPRFQVGERVLLFLEPRKDGDGYLTIGFFMGKFQVVKDPSTHQELLLRDAPEPGVGVVPAGSTPQIQKVRTLEEVRALLKP